MISRGVAYTETYVGMVFPRRETPGNGVWDSSSIAASSIYIAIFFSLIHREMYKYSLRCTRSLRESTVCLHYPRDSGLYVDLTLFISVNIRERMNSHRVNPVQETSLFA